MFPLVDPWYANWSLREPEVNFDQYPIPLTTPTAPCEKHSWAGTLTVALLHISYTGLDARALVIDESDEFYLFMDLRAEQRWVSYSTNSWKWLAATNELNSQLEVLNASKNIEHIPKHPRPLME